MIEWLKKVSLFDNLNDEQLEHVLRISQKKTFPAGTVLFHEKEMGLTFYVILSGSIKLFTRSANGDEKVLSLANTGESFGELSLLDGRPRSASAQTLEKSTVLELASEQFMNLLQAHFDITRGILTELCRRLRATNEHVNDLTFLDGRTRVLKNLIALANRNGRREGNLISIPMALNYDELAQMAGVNKTVLSEVTRELESRGVLHFELGEYRLNLDKLRS
ncbi:Crp/Fnr family transcriptional regulator [Cohnella phaseoli]|uniref:CRP/FNR family transcriptional regulator/CRP/FNR family cyclic AMP-dependent transcriptional regulator n=1 Tax=Cohnella phaseoli TaxID=456490 RepID=A0A3D9KP69_9BACL|nr:Crp/Fnr family transcriptional regulator [Cohnella phaseoli]RED87745.1 CRP/FNR family transcriptional regulator/CRP/FNR family cyclic AMP-dependent transcriptional regulator [Cohnella phaseoli]